MMVRRPDWFTSVRNRMGNSLTGFSAPRKGINPTFVALLITACFALAVYPAMPDGLTGWDPIQFALGLKHFDMAHHQPHPPGYLGHMALAWLFDRLGADAGISVRLASLLAGAGMVFGTFVLGRDSAEYAAGIVAALLAASHPLTAYSALSGESYSIEALGAVALILVGLRVTRDSGPLTLTLFFGLYGLLGGVRQSLPLYFFPFALWRLIEFCRGRKPFVRPAWFAAAAGTAIAGIAVWAIPLSLLAGGHKTLSGSFVNQFFSVFGRAYSPLMGAGLPAVLSNLDGLWRFALSALSVSGILTAVLWPFARGRASRSTSDILLFACWFIPPLAWFVLMYVYKPEHLLLWVPAFSILAGSVLTRLQGTVRRLLPVVVAAIVATQAALFLSPPIWWTGTVGAKSLPGIQYADTLSSDTARTLSELAGDNPASMMVVTRDARFTFRDAMFRLPEMQVFWMIDSDSTGVPMRGGEVCTGHDFQTRCNSGRPFWDWDHISPVATVNIGPEVRHIAWFAAPSSPFLPELRSRIGTRSVTRPPVTDFLVTDVGDGPVDLTIGPYAFIRRTPAR